MKRLLGCLSLLALVVAFADAPANAKGCIKGAIVGGIAGHVAHHGLLGAAAGCVIGHHEAAKRAREQHEQELQHQDQPPQQGTPSAPALSGTKP